MGRRLKNLPGALRSLKGRRRMLRAMSFSRIFPIIGFTNGRWMASSLLSVKTPAGPTVFTSTETATFWPVKATAGDWSPSIRKAMLLSWRTSTRAKNSTASTIYGSTRKAASTLPIRATATGTAWNRMVSTSIIWRPTARSSSESSTTWFVRMASLARRTVKHST